MAAAQEAWRSRTAAYKGWRVAAETDECQESKRTGRKTTYGKICYSCAE